MRLIWKPAVIPSGLVVISYLIIFSPPFRETGHMGLFCSALAISTYNYGTLSGIWAFLLALFFMIGPIHHWTYIRQPMVYFSFVLISFLILWFENKLRRTHIKLQTLQDKETTAIGDKIARTVHKLNDSVSAIVAIAELNMNEKPESTEIIGNNAIRVGTCVAEIRLETDKLKAIETKRIA